MWPLLDLALPLEAEGPVDHEFTAHGKDGGEDGDTADISDHRTKPLFLANEDLPEDNHYSRS